MISLAASPTSTRISPESGDTRPTADTGRENGGFSAVLAKQDSQKAERSDENPEAKVAGGKAETESAPATPNGIELPEAAESGKELPVLPPIIADDADPEHPTSESAAETPAPAETALAALVAPQVPLPTTPVASQAEESAQPGDAAPKRTKLPHPGLPAQAAAPAAAGPQAAAAAPANGTSEAATVALHVGPEAVAPTAHEASADTATDAETGSDAPAAKLREMALDRPTARSFATETARPAEPATAAAPIQSAAAPAVSASASAQPSIQVDALQELTRIVDRLAAAREVFAPAVEALAIEHAEFGELSLRFDQRRDGGLSVQLSASNPDAHRAVAQAVGAQAFQSAADDRAGPGQQGQAQTPARGGPSDREGAGGYGSAARHEQPASQQEQRRSAPQDQRQANGGRHRAGVFA